MGQINVVRAALPYTADGGSFTLVSGILTDEPIPGGVIGTMVNGAVGVCFGGGVESNGGV